MFLHKLALLAVSLSLSSFASAAAADHVPKKDIQYYEDGLAMDVLKNVYPKSGTTMPEALRKSIGHCKVQEKRNLLLENGEDYGWGFRGSALGTSKGNDTCICLLNVSYRGAPSFHLIPWSVLYCNEDHYVRLKEKPSGTCVFNGATVNVGNADYDTCSKANQEKIDSDLKLHVDVPAIKSLLEIHKRDNRGEPVVIPAIVNQTLGDCKFFQNTFDSDSGYNVKVAGSKKTFKFLKLSVRKDDTCYPTYKFPKMIELNDAYVPLSSLSCDKEGYVTFNGKLTGTCIKDGKEVNVEQLNAGRENPLVS